MSNNTLFTNHPLIHNSNQYFLEKKYVSINSEDRDYSKYPNSAEFEVLLPQEYLNVASARLYSWSFPANYNVFSAFTSNISMTFKFDTLYNPGEFGVSDPLLEAIFTALYSEIGKEYIVIIEPGFYNPDQMAAELTNKFNEQVTGAVLTFLKENVSYAEIKEKFQSYSRFNIVYNSVSQKMWFGNTADKFTLTNDSSVFWKRDVIDPACYRRKFLPEYANWGLPAYLGFSRCPTPSFSADQTFLENQSIASDPSVSAQFQVPRFYYGDTTAGSGDNGYWLLPAAPGAKVYFLQAPFKISFMGPAYMYMEVDGMNCIDETSPWNLSEYTAHNNQTNGVVNSSFAKIAIPTTPISQWFDNDMGPYKYWNPPAERISKLKFKFRYHTGQLVDFGQFEYSFMIEFNLLKPQQERNYSIRTAYELVQNQSYGSKFI
jgi:hypothetical protein